MIQDDMTADPGSCMVSYTTSSSVDGQSRNENRNQ
jgi:hypothetical protein